MTIRRPYVPFSALPPPVTPTGETLYPIQAGGRNVGGGTTGGTISPGILHDFYDPAVNPLPAGANNDAWSFEIMAAEIVPNFTLDAARFNWVRARIWLGRAIIMEWRWDPDISSRPEITRRSSTIVRELPNFDVGEDSYVRPSGTGRYQMGCTARANVIGSPSVTSFNFNFYMAARPIAPAGPGQSGSFTPSTYLG